MKELSLFICKRVTEIDVLAGYFHDFTGACYSTLSDSSAPYSKCATPYTIGLWRKYKSCDQKHGCHSEIFVDHHCTVSHRTTSYSLYHVTRYLFFILYCMVSRYWAESIDEAHFLHYFKFYAHFMKISFWPRDHRWEKWIQSRKVPSGVMVRIVPVCTILTGTILTKMRDIFSYWQ